MVDEYIRKADAIDTLEAKKDKSAKGDIGCFYNTIIQNDIDALNGLPSADVAPVVHGRWLPIVSYNNTYKCSECGRLLVDITDGLKMVAKHYPYCHCGAKMDGERKE